jgi:tetratricopeptide (TPR) repeat protein
MKLVEKLFPKTLNEISEEAIAHALAGRWDQAAMANAEALRIAPGDVDSHNRQAKALLELGRYAEAKAEAEAALRLRPGHAIARRHLERIGQLQSNGKVARLSSASPVARPSAFIADRAASTVTELRNPAPAPVLAASSPGDPLKLVPDGARVKVVSLDGKVLGSLETRLAQHLLRLIQGGNRYEAALTKAAAGSVAVVVREAYKSPKQAGTVSFPPSLQKYSAVRHEVDDEDERGEMLDGGFLQDEESSSEDDIPEPQEARSARLRAVLSRDSEDDGMISDDALAV